MSEDFIYTGDSVLDVMSKYAVNRNNFIEQLIRKSLLSTSKAMSILELGAGRGEFINRFVNEPGITPFSVEPDKQYNINLNKTHTCFLSLEEVSEPIDCAYAIDVMEHIENDEDVLKQLYQKVKNNGKLLIYVPARMELYSQFDKNIGHFRRYHKKELAQKITNAGFKIEKITYHELLGYFAAFTNKFQKTGQLNAKSVSVYDKIFVPTTNFIERFFHPPIGKSLYVIASKNE